MPLVWTLHILLVLHLLLESRQSHVQTNSTITALEEGKIYISSETHLVHSIAHMILCHQERWKLYTSLLFRLC